MKTKAWPIKFQKGKIEEINLKMKRIAMKSKKRKERKKKAEGECARLQTGPNCQPPS
jgi:hypothetical protein